MKFDLKLVVILAVLVLVAAVALAMNTPQQGTGAIDPLALEMSAQPLSRPAEVLPPGSKLDNPRVEATQSSERQAIDGLDRCAQIQAELDRVRYELLVLSQQHGISPKDLLHEQQVNREMAEWCENEKLRLISEIVARAPLVYSDPINYPAAQYFNEPRGYWWECRYGNNGAISSVVAFLWDPEIGLVRESTLEGDDLERFLRFDSVGAKVTTNRYPGHF